MYRKLCNLCNKRSGFSHVHPHKGYTLALLRHLFGEISLVNVINRFSVCIAKIPQSPVWLRRNWPMTLHVIMNSNLCSLVPSPLLAAILQWPEKVVWRLSLVPSPLPAAILQWPEKVVWRLWWTFLGLEASSDYVTLVGTARCEICTGKMEVPRCAVCS